MGPSTRAPRRVVVTGVGAVGPVGLDVPTSWQRIIAGQSGIGPITLFPAEDFRVRIAGQAWGFDPLTRLSARQAHRADRCVQFALTAAIEAMEQASLRRPLDPDIADVTGTYIGSGAGGVATYMAQQAVLDERGPARMSPLAIPMLVVDSASVQVSILADARGPSVGVASACSTGSDAIGLAFDMIVRGHADVMITGGAEAAITGLGVGGFDQMNALSRRNDAPAAASRPFDACRDGFVLSEGAGIVVLEALEHAQRRGAAPLAEMLGWSATADALHLTKPDPTARQAARAIRQALERSGLVPADVGYVNAHATGTRQGDVFEVLAFKNAFGKAAADVPVSSTKSITGHLLGAAGSTEFIWCVMALRDGVLPPTINYETRDPACDLDVVPNVARRKPIRVALSNSFGLGGHNTVIALSRWEPSDTD